MKKRAQTSMEYVLIMGFAFLITIPLILIYFTSSADTAQQVSVTQMEQVARKLTETADIVHSLGEPSFTTVRAQLPEETINISFVGQTLIIYYHRNDGVGELASVASANLSGYIKPSPGLHVIRVQAFGEQVIFSET